MVRKHVSIDQLGPSSEIHPHLKAHITGLGNHYNLHAIALNSRAIKSINKPTVQYINVDIIAIEYVYHATEKNLSGFQCP